MEIVAVTGSSGLVGANVVRRLQHCERVQEIRLIDRVKRDFDVCSPVHLRHFVLDLCDESGVERALAGCTTVVHCAHAPIPVKYQTKEKKRQMWNDNLQASEIVIDKMICRSVPRIVYVGDAYSALPAEDNYGQGEQIFNDFPKTYLLGEFGESRTRAEMYARGAVKKNASLTGIFLRPVHVHGETDSVTFANLKSFAQTGSVPYIEGDRRGMHQFIYSGNLAAIVEKSVLGLADRPELFSGEIVYCLDQCNLVPYREFFEPRAKTPLYSATSSVSFTNSWMQHYYQYIRSFMGLQVSEDTLSYPIFRLLFEKTVGFSMKKQRLLLNHIPEVPQEKALALTETPMQGKPQRTAKISNRQG